MRHCCNFKPDDIYYLRETNLYIYRMFTIGFCPSCGKPVAELYQLRFDRKPEKICWAGVDANDAMIKYNKDILYSMQETNYRKQKSKPFGWKYGLNRTSKGKDGKISIRQYACDFYGNKELIKNLTT